MAFLLLLDGSRPGTRGHVLHDIFDQPYAKSAAAAGVQQAGLRKLVSRAPVNVGEAVRGI